MTKRRWITVGLTALAIGGLAAAYPFTSSAVETPVAAKTLPAVTVAQPAATAPEPGTGGCGGAGGMMGGAAGGMMGGMMKGGMGGMMQGAYGGIVAESVYKLTGLDKQEIIKDRRAGKSFVEIAKAKGFTEDQLLEAVKKDHKAFIDQRVKDGVMTQEMADYCTKNFETNIKSILENTAVATKAGRGKGFGGMMGGMMQGGMGGMMGGWGQQAPSVPSASIQGESI